MADRQQHIDTLARHIEGGRPGDVPAAWSRQDAERILDSTDPRVHDALTAALHANADRDRVLAAHADNGWLAREAPDHSEYGGGLNPALLGRRRYVSEWEAQ